MFRLAITGSETGSGESLSAAGRRRHMEKQATPPHVPPCFIIDAFLSEQNWTTKCWRTLNVLSFDSKLAALYIYCVKQLTHEIVWFWASTFHDTYPYFLQTNQSVFTRIDSLILFSIFQFCEWLKSLIRDQRNILLTALLGLLSMLCLGISPSTALPTLLIPFTLWMAS